VTAAPVGVGWDDLLLLLLALTVSRFIILDSASMSIIITLSLFSAPAVKLTLSIEVMLCELKLLEPQ